MDAFNLFNHPQYGDPAAGSINGANYGIGFNASAANEYVIRMDAAFAVPGSNHRTAHADPLSSAVSLRNTSPNAQVGTVGTQSDRNREFQYSLRFTF